MQFDRDKETNKSHNIPDLGTNGPRKNERVGDQPKKDSGCNIKVEEDDVTRNNQQVTRPPTED